MVFDQNMLNGVQSHAKGKHQLHKLLFNLSLAVLLFFVFIVSSQNKWQAAKLKSPKSKKAIYFIKQLEVKH